MKVTVCFDTVRVVVPCGDGEMHVGDLIEKAVSRYTKVIGKAAGDCTRVVVHYLKSADGGILDSDDRLVDVVDDKDLLNASFEVIGDSLSPPSSTTEQRQHSGGDGKSVCGSPTEGGSGGPSSPDEFRAPKGGFTAATFMKAAEQGGIIAASHRRKILEDQSILDLTSSPMALKTGGRSNHFVQPNAAVRFHDAPSTPVRKNLEDFDASATTPLILEPRAQGSGRESFTSSAKGIVGKTATEDDDDDNDVDTGTFHAFVRDPARKSLNNNAAMLRWLDAQDRLMEKSEDEQYRKDPVGSSDEAEINQSNRFRVDSTSSHNASLAQSGEHSSSFETLIALQNPGCPLGIHVVPSFDAHGRNTGLEIYSIEPDSPVARDGRLQVHDRIIGINGSSFAGIDFYRAQEVFHMALRSPTIHLHVITSTSSHGTSSIDRRSLGKGYSLTTPENVSKSLDSAGNDFPVVTASDYHHLKPPDQFCESDETSNIQSPGLIKVRPPVPTRTTSTGIQKTKFAPISSTRLIGQVVSIELVKGPQGLGFSVTTRDNPAGNDSPIYVKNILPQGAAVLDGRLQTGDRLLQVNGIDMSGKSQEDVVSLLRSIKTGAAVNLMISRLVPGNGIPSDDSLSRDSTLAKTDCFSSTVDEKIVTDHHIQKENVATTNEDEELITLRIPVEDKGAEQTSILGASIKGKTSNSGNNVSNLGLFVTAIIAGSAAEKDGRLKPDDRLVQLNGVSLMGLSNNDAMTDLRRALRLPGPSPGCIELIVARRKSSASIADTSVWDLTPRKHAQPNDSADSPSIVRAAGSPTTSGSGHVTSRPATAVKPSNKLRNMSYHMANDELPLTVARMSDGADISLNPTPIGPTVSSNASAPTILGGRFDTVLIETEGSGASFRSTSSSNSSRSGGSSRRRRKKVVTSTKNTSNGVSPDEVNDSIESHTTKRPGELMLAHDVTLESSESSPLDVDPAIAFSREGLGRQSMSEKRKGHADPRVTAFYQQVKLARGKQNKYESKDSLQPRVDSQSNNGDDITLVSNQDRPSSRLYRCCSLESVSMAHDIRTEMEQQPLPGVSKIHRNRGCNESFRAAVDRSYVRNGATNTDEPRQQHQSNDDYSDKKNGRGKQKTLLKSFGDVFKIGKSKTNDRERAEKAYNPREAESLRDIENNVRYDGSSKSNSRLANDRVANIQQAAGSPITATRRGHQTVSPMVGFASRQENSQPPQWSSPEYAVLTQHRGQVNGGSNDYPTSMSAASSSGYVGDVRMQARLAPTNISRATSNVSISQPPLDSHLPPSKFSYSPASVVSGLNRPVDDLRSLRPSSSDIYSASSSNLQRLQQQHRRPATAASSSLAHQQAAVASAAAAVAAQKRPYVNADGFVVGSSQPPIVRPANGVIPASTFRQERHLADRAGDGSSGSLTRRQANGFAVAGNYAGNGAVYKLSQPANV